MFLPIKRENDGFTRGRPLSIALLIETVGLAGAEMVVAQLAEALRDRGHEVHPVVPAGREGWLVDEMLRTGFPCHRYDLRRPIDPGFPARLAAQIGALNVDVVHSHEFVMAVYGAAAARRLRLPHVVTMHGNQTTTAKLQRRVALRWALKQSDAAVAVSNDTKQHLVETLGLRDDALQVIRNGIPARPGNRAAIRAELGLRDDELLLLSVGSLSPRKAHAVLLEAMIMLHNAGDRSPWRLAIVGEGPERPRLESMIAEDGLAGRVHLMGARTDVPDIQAAADIFVLPSLWEGLPLALLEGMFGGNAVIASNISGIPEAIENGKHGLLTPPGDCQALADAIGSVLRDARFRNQLANAALERAHQEFTIDAMANAYERLYVAGL